jgi:hypothetical protein
MKLKPTLYEVFLACDSANIKNLTWEKELAYVSGNHLNNRKRLFRLERQDRPARAVQPSTPVGLDMLLAADQCLEGLAAVGAQVGPVILQQGAFLF